jgi:hypothetical protein
MEKANQIEPLCFIDFNWIVYSNFYRLMSHFTKERLSFLCEKDSFMQCCKLNFFIYYCRNQPIFLPFKDQISNFYQLLDVLEDKLFYKRRKFKESIRGR